MVAYVSAAHALVHAFELTYAAVLAILIIEFESGLFLLGVLAWASAFAFGAAALPAGILADRLGSKSLLSICFLASAGFSVLVALSPSLYVLTVGLVGLGLSIGLYHPAGLALISRGVRTRALGMGYHGMAGNLGIAMTPFLAAGVASLINWRASYILLAILAIVLLVIMHISPVQEQGDYKNEERSKGLSGARGEGSRKGLFAFALSERDKEELRPLLMPLIALYLAFMFSGFIYRGMITFLPFYIKERVNVDIWGIDPVAVAGAFATIALLFGVVGQYVGGSLAHRIQMERIIVPVAVMITLLLLLMGVMGGVVLMVAAAALAFFYFMGQPVYNTLVATYTPPAMQGRSFGISFFATFGLGSFAGIFGGFIAQETETRWVFISLAGFGLMALALAIYLLKTASTRVRPGGIPQRIVID